MENKWIEVFRAGRNTDSSGKTRTWTEADLDHIVRNFEPQGDTVPLVIGHPNNDASSPAWGWVKAVRRVGNSLQVRLRNLVPEFVEGVKQKMWPNRSIRLVKTNEGGYELGHIGFLGASPPAIKGMTTVFQKYQECCDFQYQQDEKGIEMERKELIQLIQEVIGQNSQIQQGQIEQFFQGQPGQQVVQGQPQGSQLQGTQPQGSQPQGTQPQGTQPQGTQPQGTQPQGTQPQGSQPQGSQLQGTQPQGSQPQGTQPQGTQPQGTQPQGTQEGTQNSHFSALQQQNQLLQRQIESIQRERISERNKIWLERQVQEGRLMPPQTEGMSEFIASLPRENTFSFASATTGSKIQLSHNAWFKRFVESLPQHQLFNSTQFASSNEANKSEVEAIIESRYPQQKGDK